MAEIKRKKNTGEPGNGGQFGSKTHSEGEVRLTVVGEPVGVVTVAGSTHEAMLLSERTDDPQVLDDLAGHRDNEVRRSVASNPSTLASTLERSVGDEDWGVRMLVAGSSQLSAESLHGLSADPNAAVRCLAALNRNTAESDLETLSTDEAWNVRSNVAINPGAPGSILETLAKDGHDTVRSLANRTLGARRRRREDPVSQPRGNSGIRRGTGSMDNPITVTRPLTVDEAMALRGDNGFVSFDITVDENEYRAASQFDAHGLCHRHAFSFGYPCDSLVQVTGGDGGTVRLRYTTNVGKMIHQVVDGD